MPSPPNGTRVELLALIDEMEAEFRRTCDVNAQVSNDALRRLREIRAELLRAEPSRGRRITLAVGKVVLAKLAVELIRWILSHETSIYRFTAVFPRIQTYDGWRRNQNASSLGGSEADGPRGARKRVHVVDLVDRGRATRADTALAA